MTASARRGLGVAAAAVIAVIAAVIVLGGGEDRHSVYVTVPKATGIIAGQHVRAAGSIVGEVGDITPVDRGRAAKLEIRLDDGVWPLPEGSRFTVRWGGTINLYNRYVALEPGKAGGAPMVADGGMLPPSAFKVPVEYGELLNVFNKSARGDLKEMLNRGGSALKLAGPRLEKALEVAPGAVAEGDAVLSELDRSRADVEALVLSTDRVVDAVQRADPGLGELVQGAGTTLNALAVEAGSLQKTLDDSPQTFRRATSTLKRADGTLAAAETLTRRLGPGVTELRRISRPLNGVLGTLQDVTPSAKSTLRTAGTAAPDLTTLLSTLKTQTPMISSISKQADVALNCIRPYSPEIASFGSLWGSALAGVDGIGKYIRATPTVSLPAPTMAESKTSEQAVKEFGGLSGLTYAYPRPPGTQAGQPWLLEECRAGKDAFDPSKDPEARNFNALMQLPAPAKGRKP